MKPYNGPRTSKSKNTMLKSTNWIEGSTKALLNVLEAEAQNILQGQDLKRKTSTLSLGLNSPKNALTEAEIIAYFGGHDFVHKYNILRAKYHNALDVEKQDKLTESYEHVLLEVRFNIKWEQAQRIAD